MLSPRPSDPHPWHAYFVSPPITASQPPYQLFVKATDWGQLWTNVNFSDTNDRRVVPESIGGTTVRCLPRASWDGRVPAVFVTDGVVYDVRVRYQGSRWNRPNGNEIDLGRTTHQPPAPADDDPHLGRQHRQRARGRSAGTSASPASAASRAAGIP